MAKDQYWYLKSKGMIAGIALIIYSVLHWYLFGEFKTETFLLGLGILGIRHKLEKK